MQCPSCGGTGYIGCGDGFIGCHPCSVCNGTGLFVDFNAIGVNHGVKSMIQDLICVLDDDVTRDIVSKSPEAKKLRKLLRKNK